MTVPANEVELKMKTTKPFGVNAWVTMALALHLNGSTAHAEGVMQTIAGWWNSTRRCIMEPAAIRDGFCYTRALSYFLFGMRALRLTALLPVDQITAMEEQLWACQVVTDNNTMAANAAALTTQYSFKGVPMRVDRHSSTEPSNLALLAYDPRIETEWFLPL